MGYYNSAGQRLATEAFVNQNVNVLVNVYKYFTSNTTFTVPSGVTSLTVAVTGAGGGGGGYTQYHTYMKGGGGGAGGYVKGIISVTPGQKLSIVVGKAGSGGGHSGETGLPGGAGGASSISGYATCNGGGAGSGNAGSYAGGKGGTCSYTLKTLQSYVAGEAGIKGGGSYWSYVTNSSMGGASAHGRNANGSSSVYGAGGWGGTNTLGSSWGYNGSAGGLGLVQIWYKTDIRNITF